MKTRTWIPIRFLCIWVPCVVPAAGAAACGGGGATGPAITADSMPGPDAAAPNPDTGDHDLPAPGDAADSAPDPVHVPDDASPDGPGDPGIGDPDAGDPSIDPPDTPADVEHWQPDTGCGGGPGCECASDAQCASGVCTGTPHGSECAGPCDAGCPAGWACLPVPSGAAGSVCLAPSQLCRPCKTDFDCDGPLPGNNACIGLGPAGRFCGANCTVSGACPDGFDCTDVPVTGGTARQCVPAGGAGCPCLDRFAGLKTVCHVANEHGQCTAERTCADACPAAVPAPEACNGADDDCDGETDEGAATGCKEYCRDKDEDGWGGDECTCLCAPAPGFPAPPGDCDDLDPDRHPGAAICGEDGDCDGLLLDVGEECDDGNDDPFDQCKECKIPCPPGSPYLAGYCWVVGEVGLKVDPVEACAKIGKTAAPVKAPMEYDGDLANLIAEGLGYLATTSVFGFGPRIFCSDFTGKCASSTQSTDYYDNSVPGGPGWDPTYRRVHCCIP